MVVNGCFGLFSGVLNGFMFQKVTSAGYERKWLVARYGRDMDENEKSLALDQRKNGTLNVSSS